MFRSSIGISPPGVKIRVPRRKQWPLPLTLGRPSAFAFLEIDARIGRLTAPVAATFPAKPAEISRKRLRDEWDTGHLKNFKSQLKIITKNEQCKVARANAAQIKS